MTYQTANLRAPRRTNRLRIACHPALGEYWRLAVLILIVNAGLFWTGLQNNRWWTENAFVVGPLADMALVNLSLAIIIRQQRLINFLFKLATCIPLSWPLSIRREAAKVFHFGGLHFGGACLGTAWFGLMLYGMVWNYMRGLGSVSETTIWITAFMLTLLLAMILTALSFMRHRFHNLFERMHRFGGWSVLIAFWAQTISITRDSGAHLTETPAFWALCVLTLSIVSPWLTLKRVPVKVIKPSSHAVILRLNYGDGAFPGSYNSISLSPLKEWHAFASIPSPSGQGYRLLVSRAGDWTSRFIDHPPSHVWVKGITTSGMASVEELFRRVIFVATGSGIGPILPIMQARHEPFRLLWSTRSPRATYGHAILNEIGRVCPDAVIWDTDAYGKPNLTAVTLRLCREFNAEAVICISNRKSTRKLVHDVQQRGIPAFGPIWDS